MKPSEITKVLDLAKTLNEKKKRFNPLFVGPPGIGKSKILQQWCNENGYDFRDVRLAYKEAPDMIGFPSVVLKNGRQVTTHNIPDFWPSEGKGIIFLDELNRGVTSVMNTVMQLLTDRKVDSYTLPEGWFVAGAINPESNDDDVNTMGAALKNRWQIFNVNYDKGAFIQHMRRNDWNETVRLFVESNTWVYSKPEDVGTAPGAKYISPRDLEPLSDALNANIIEEKDEVMFFESMLGTNYARTFYSFKNKEMPVLYKDLLEDTKTALNRLKKFSDPSNYKAGHLSITVRDIVDNKEITDDLLAKVLLVIPSDLGPELIKQLELSKKDDKLFNRIVTNYPEVGKQFKESLKKK